MPVRDGKPIHVGRGSAQSPLAAEEHEVALEHAQNVAVAGWRCSRLVDDDLRPNSVVQVIHEEIVQDGVVATAVEENLWRKSDRLFASLSALKKWQQQECDGEIEGEVEGDNEVQRT